MLLAEALVFNVSFGFYFVCIVYVIVHKHFSEGLLSTFVRLALSTCVLLYLCAPFLSK